MAAFVPDLDGHAISPAFTAPPWFDSRPSKRLRGRRIGEGAVSPALPVPFPCTNHRRALEDSATGRADSTGGLGDLVGRHAANASRFGACPGFLPRHPAIPGPLLACVRCSCRPSVLQRLCDDRVPRRSAGASPALSVLRGFGAGRCVQCSAPLISGTEFPAQRSPENHPEHSGRASSPCGNSGYAPRDGTRFHSDHGANIVTNPNLLVALSCGCQRLASTSLDNAGTRVVPPGRRQVPSCPGIWKPGAETGYRERRAASSYARRGRCILGLGSRGTVSMRVRGRWCTFAFVSVPAVFA